MTKKLKLRLPSINVVIEGKTVILAPLSEKEINQQYVSWLNDPEVNEFLGVRHKKQNMRDIYNYVNGLRLSKDCEVFAIFTKSNRCYIGNIAVTPPHIASSEPGISSFGIIIGDKNAQKIGFGAEASILIVDFIFCRLNAERLELGAVEENCKSWRMLELIGFKREGVLRQHSVSTNGKRSNTFLYAMLKD